MLPVLAIRRLEAADNKTIAAAFQAIGWHKTESLFERYFLEQSQGTRLVLVASIADDFAGYVTINWSPAYEPFQHDHIPEIQDFNVLPNYRRRGIGSALMDAAEALVSERSPVIGIGVGLYTDYGAAQRMYVKRGYIPDGRGIFYGDHLVLPGEQIRVDDDLVLYFSKSFSESRTRKIY